MKRWELLVTSVILALSLALGGNMSQAQASAGGPEPQVAMGTAFTYQGLLRQGGVLVTQACDVRFSLWDSATGGAQIGTTQTFVGVVIVQGVFTVAALDFGTGAFDGQTRWLELAVRCPTGVGDFTLLSPRQVLTPTPYALFSATAPWRGLLGVPAGFADGIDQDILGGMSCSNGQVVKWNGTAWTCADDEDTQYTAGMGLMLTGKQFAVDTTTIQARVVGTCASGSAVRVINADGTVVCQATVSPAAWLLSGNAGTTPGINFLGTTDNQALELKVNGARALRLEPQPASPNLIGGYNGNGVAVGVVGAVIGGGGAVAGEHRVSANYGTIGGGLYNTVSGAEATVAGGSDNTASGGTATVGGGGANMATALAATVGGGAGNRASGERSTVGGGSSNTASGEQATVSGGAENEATAARGFIGGGNSNVASAPRATIGGGYSNDVTALSGTVAGGDLNLAGGRWAAVGGGESNQARADYATIAGGGMTDPLDEKTGNRVTDTYGAVGGGGNNQAGNADSDLTNASFATVGGGQENLASGSRSTVSGGQYNTASGLEATISGGGYNLAEAQGATVGGGANNKASSHNATISGGAGNIVRGVSATVGGGNVNQVEGQVATVSGGSYNKASAWASAVPGGSWAKAWLSGQMSQASGRFTAGVTGEGGEAQSSVFVLRNVTTPMTPTIRLALNGDKQLLTIADGQTLSLDILVVGRESTGVSAGYAAKCVVKRVGATTSMVGSLCAVAPIGVDPGAGGWVVKLIVDDSPTVEGFSVEVTAQSSTNVRWVATIRTAEVAWWPEGMP